VQQAIHERLRDIVSSWCLSPPLCWCEQCSML
jgi:hypothetical protein